MKTKSISIKEHQIEQTFNEMMGNIKHGDLRKVLRSKFAKFKKDFDGNKLGYSFDTFIKSELDFQTSGDRGIGRLSEQIPRFGGYYRKHLSQISHDKITELYNLIYKILLRGYLTGVLMLSEDLEEAVISEKKDLFERWIPNIYVTPLNSLGPGLQNALLAFCGPSVDDLLAYLEMNQIKQRGLLRRDKAGEIISYYIVAGCGLRITETGK